MIIEQVKPWVKTSLAPGSGVVTKYLLQRYKFEPLNYELNCPFSSLGETTLMLGTEFCLCPLVVAFKST